MEEVVKGIGGEYTGNYTGPYWSNGRVQPSVEWGDLDPTSELDYLSRQHDSAYARWKDDAHRHAADRYYNEQAKKLSGQFPELARNLVLYGNEAERSLKRTATNVSNGFKLFGLGGALAGLVYTAAGNIVRSNDMLTNPNYLKKETQDVLEYYKTDPRKKAAPVTPQLSTKVVNPSHLVGGPTEKDVRKANLVADQVRRVENHATLKENALQSATKSKNSDTNPVPILGHRPIHLQQAFRKRKKKNKIHLAPIRI